jgi:hypothetical protein
MKNSWLTLTHLFPPKLICHRVLYSNSEHSFYLLHDFCHQFKLTLIFYPDFYFKFLTDLPDFPLFWFQLILLTKSHNYNHIGKRPKLILKFELELVIIQNQDLLDIWISL